LRAHELQKKRRRPFAFHQKPTVHAGLPRAPITSVAFLENCQRDAPKSCSCSGSEDAVGESSKLRLLDLQHARADSRYVMVTIAGRMRRDRANNNDGMGYDI
jgi:hypothetical protein